MALPSVASFILGKQYTGIEHFTLNKEEKVALVLVENKNEGLIITQKDRVGYSDKIADKWGKKLPFFLIVNTSQVIQKEIASTDASDEKLLHKAFPNTNWEDFYFEIWRLKTKSLIAIARKGYVNELVNHYKNQKITVAGISLGVCSAVEIMQFADQNQLATNHQVISKNEEENVLSVVAEEEQAEYRINGLQIENRQLLAFSGILRLIATDTENTGSVINYSEELQNQYNQQSLFSKVLKAGIGLVLAILVVNFMFFNHYYKLAQETAEIVMLNKSSIEELQKTKQRIKVKEERYHNTLRKNASQSSLVINEIARKVPSSILLTELVFQPLVKKMKEGESILFEEKIILIKGNTIANNDFTQWLETIEKLKEIKQVIITHFGKNDTNETEFSIKVNLK